MPMSLESYNDVKVILDKAIAAGGGSYRLKSPGSATAWRHRANRFRKAYRERTHDSTYDLLSIGLNKGSDTVTIEPRVGQQGEFIPTDNPVPMPEAAPLPKDDDLLAEALEIARKLDL